MACMLVGTVSSSVALPTCARTPSTKNLSQLSELKSTISPYQFNVIVVCWDNKAPCCRMSAEVLAVLPTARVSCATRQRSNRNSGSGRFPCGCPRCCSPLFFVASRAVCFLRVFIFLTLNFLFEHSTLQNTVCQCFCF